MSPEFKTCQLPTFHIPVFCYIPSNMLKAKCSKAEPEIKIANIKFVARKETKGHKVTQTLDRKKGLLFHWSGSRSATIKCFSVLLH